EAVRYLLPVAAVTTVCCLLALRWAIDQFNKEAVLFRESERFDLVLWLRHLVRDRRDTPTVAAAIMCGVLILAVKFFLELSLVGAVSKMHVTLAILLPQLVCILAPALLMTSLLARSPRQTLLLRWPRRWTVPAAVALAVLMHPVAAQIAQAIQQLYRLDPRIAQAAEGL